MRPKPKISPLDKRIKPNPRYKNIEPTINTGNNLRKELERLEEVHQFYKFRTDEVFRRVNINSLVRLVTEVTKLEYQLQPPNSSQQMVPEDCASEFNDSYIEQLEIERDTVDNLNDEEVELNEDIGSIIQSQFDPVASNRPSVSRQTVRSVTSLALGVGEMDDDNEKSQESSQTNRPFLLLDVRESEQYNRSHLVYSVNYPHTRLNRAFDYELSDMLRLKNKEKGIIVVYDDDETIASKSASTLTQRGYDNVFLLSGGLRVAGLKYPESLLVSETVSRLSEGDVMVLERQLEENIMTGSSSRLSKGGSSARSLARSISLDRGTRIEAPIRTSTALRH